MEDMINDVREYSMEEVEEMSEEEFDEIFGWTYDNFAPGIPVIDWKATN